MSMLVEFKVVTVGDSGVGKTTIVNKFYNSAADVETTPTVGASYITCHVDVPETGEVTLNIWDTAGQEKFQSLIPLYMRNARGVIFVFDLSVTNTIASVERQFGAYREIIEADSIVIICGNKLDLVADRSFCSEVEAWAAQREMKCFWTSGITGEGINQMFTSLGAKLATKMAPMRKSAVDEIIQQEQTNRACC